MLHKVTHYVQCILANTRPHCLINMVDKSVSKIVSLQITVLALMVIATVYCKRHVLMPCKQVNSMTVIIS